MTTGTIARWIDQRGFGFVLPDGGTDSLFLHISAISPQPTDPPRMGDRYQFDVQAGLDGRPRAVNARALSAEAEEVDRVFGGR